MAERWTAIKSIRRYCVDVCCAGDEAYARECPSDGRRTGKGQATNCPLHPYRMGKNPNISEETKAKRREIAIKTFGQSGDTKELQE